MARLLYLVHRLPYPPNKGDKVRSYHLLRHLAQRHQVYLGCFVDDPDDLQHLDTLRTWCADLCALPLSPPHAKVRSLLALALGQPLTLRYYHDSALHRWVSRTVAAQAIDAALVFSSSMGPYALAQPQLPVLADLVDVDSAKWAEYGSRHRWPLSWLYRREGRTLLDYERTLVQQARQSYLVTDHEVALFDRLAPDCRGRVKTLGNGVDAQFFSPDAGRSSPFAEAELPLVFTGAMDYWPNVDAVQWCVREMLPALRQRWPALRLHIVGRNPGAEVQALAGDAVSVTGTVPDVRPYLQHAAAVVAPLRLARGVQNKVLEAMAMARPVVAAAPCVAAIGCQSGTELLAADSAEDYVRQIDRALADAAWAQQVGAAARARVLAHDSWQGRLAALDRDLAEVLTPRRGAAQPGAEAGIRQEVYR